jgi:hypothetical protein
VKHLLRRMSRSNSSSFTVSVRTWAPHSGVIPSAITRSMEWVRNVLPYIPGTEQKVQGKGQPREVATEAMRRRP